MATARNNTAVSSIAAPSGAVGDDSTIVSFGRRRRVGIIWMMGPSPPTPMRWRWVIRTALQSTPSHSRRTPQVNETEAMAMRKLTGAVAGGLWVQFHTGDPGANGTSNAISELGRVQVTQAQWTIA